MKKKYTFFSLIIFSTFQPSSAEVIINEFLSDPAPDITGDANGDGVRSAVEDEFIELYNDSNIDVDVSGWTISDSLQVRHLFPVGTIIPANRGMLIFGGGSPTGSFGGSLVQVASTGAFGLNNGGETITLEDGPLVITHVDYGAILGGNNQSATLNPDVTGLAYVQHSLANNSSGSLFSPGTCINGSDFNECGSDQLEISIIINEFLADPAPDITGDANGDGNRSAVDDEFIELYNDSNFDVNISGWTISDSTLVRHIFPEGTTIPAKSGMVIFGGGSPTGTFGGSLVQVASTGGFGLNNGGDTITLEDGQLMITHVDYGAILGGNNQSATLNPDITGITYVEHSTANGSSSRLFSPGTCVNGLDLIVCGNELIFRDGFE